jgi:choice-of-anchor B domain-containing protein
MASRIALHVVLAGFLLLGASETPAATGDITLVGHLSLPDASRLTNVWGYYNYATGKEYALVGDWYAGVYVIDVSNSANPIEVTKILGVPGFDLKPFGHYLYTCDSNNTGYDSRIIDLSNPAVPVVLPTTFHSCHTISISTRGVMFTNYVGVRIYDLVNDPTHPDSLFYIQTNAGHDTTPRGDRLYDFAGARMNIWSVSDPSAPSLIGWDDNPLVQYYHGGDESKDHDYLYMCDEFAVTPTPDIVIYDISDPSIPTRIGSINDLTSRVHQLYVVGDLMFVGYYTAGFKVFDISNPWAPVLADEFDTSPFQTETGSDLYSGAYNAYPFAPSGIVYVADWPTGLYLFSVEGHTGQVTAAQDSPPTATLAQNFPNPFNPSTTIAFELARREHVMLRVYDVRGSLVQTLVDETLAAGAHTAPWSGVDASGQAVASGVYYYQLDAGPTSLTRRMVLLK